MSCFRKKKKNTKKNTNLNHRKHPLLCFQTVNRTTYSPKVVFYVLCVSKANWRSHHMFTTKRSIAISKRFCYRSLVVATNIDIYNKREVYFFAVLIGVKYSYWVGKHEGKVQNQCNACSMTMAATILGWRVTHFVFTVSTQQYNEAKLRPKSQCSISRRKGFTGIIDHRTDPFFRTDWTQRSGFF